MNEIHLTYIGIVIVVILCLLFLSHCYYKKNKIETSSYEIMVYTPKGLIRVDNKETVEELYKIRKLLANVSSASGEIDNDLTPMINDSINSLLKFIKKNPDANLEALCQLDLSQDILKDAMQDSVSPNELDWRGAYKVVLDMEDDNIQYINPREKLIYLIKHLDVAIHILRNKVCNNGRLDFNKLYNILKYINHKINNNDGYILDGLNDKYFNDNSRKLNFTSYSDKLGMYDATQITGDTSESLDTLSAIIPIKEGMANNLEITLMTKYKNTTSSDPFINNASIEDSVEQDIINQRDAGSSFSTTTNTDKFITVLNDKCLGKTRSDEELINNCTQFDITHLLAVNGGNNAGDILCNI